MKQKPFLLIGAFVGVIAIGLLLFFSLTSREEENIIDQDQPSLPEETVSPPETTLRIERGIVLVNGQEAHDGRILVTGDEIVVDKDGSARIVFFDDSVSRLQAGTRVKVAVLNDENFDIGQSHILLDLESGEVWSKVQKATGPNVSFEIKTTTVNAAIRGSVQNVFSDGGCRVVVTASEHTTDVTGTDRETMLVEGQQAEIVNPEKCSDQENLPPESFTVTDISPERQSSDWFRENERKDEEYQYALRQKIQTERLKEAGALPGTPEYEEQLRDDQTRLFDAAGQRWKVELEIAARQLLEAEVLLLRGEGEMVKNLFSTIKTTVLRIAQGRGKNRDVERYIRCLINRARLRLRLTLPSDPEYIVKDFLTDLEIDLTPPEFRQDFRKRKFKERILDLYDLSKTGTPEEVDQALQEFRKHFGDQFLRNPAFREFLKEQIAGNPYLERLIRRGSSVDKRRLFEEFFTEEIDSIPEFKALLPESSGSDTNTRPRTTQKTPQLSAEEQAILDEQRRLEGERRLEELRKQMEENNNTDTGVISDPPTTEPGR